MSCRDQQAAGAYKRIEDELARFHLRHVAHHKRKARIHARVANEFSIFQIELVKYVFLALANLYVHLNIMRFVYRKT